MLKSTNGTTIDLLGYIFSYLAKNIYVDDVHIDKSIYPYQAAMVVYLYIDLQKDIFL